MKRAWRPLVCVLEPDSAMGNQYLVEPLDARFPKVIATAAATTTTSATATATHTHTATHSRRHALPQVNVTTRQAEQLLNKIIVVTIDFWEASHRFPTGHYVRTIGDVGNTEAESEAILMEHEVKTSPFSAQVTDVADVTVTEVTGVVARHTDTRSDWIDRGYPL